MGKKLKILMVSSEMAPYAKTGGLADVTSSLSMNLKKQGHDVRVVIPFYKKVKKVQTNANVVLESMCVTMGLGEEWCRVLETKSGDVPVFFIEHDNFFDRWGLYHDEWMRDYDDNPRRFSFFCRAALQLCLDTQFAPDIVHSNDWQTAPSSAYIKTWFWNNHLLGNTASVLTIHNVAYQGVYPADHYDYMGLGKHCFHEKAFESWRSVNFLKGGIYYSDMINTVSPGHAKEIITPFQGFGLAPYLTDKKDRFIGILNGVDYTQWSPDKDNLIPANYSLRSMKGKKTCKKELQKSMGLEQKEDAMIIGAIGRFVEQKGFHLIKASIERILNDMVVQFVVLGQGEQDQESFFWDLPSRFKGRAGSYIGFSNELAHLIEAGSDCFCMPSLFEPCGLNQLYSLRYGTLPIVHATGGLEDTIEQYDEKTGLGTGFKFWKPTPESLYYTVGWAVSTYYDRPHHFKTMVRNAMKKDFSWKKTVKEYENCYYKAIEVKKGYDNEFIR